VVRKRKPHWPALLFLGIAWIGLGVWDITLEHVWLGVAKCVLGCVTLGYAVRERQKQRTDEPAV
jgi:hypothetical protein